MALTKTKAHTGFDTAAKNPNSNHSYKTLATIPNSQFSSLHHFWNFSPSKTLVFFLLEIYICIFWTRFYKLYKKEKDRGDDSRNSSSTDRNAGFFFIEKDFACRYSRWTEWSFSLCYFFVCLIEIAMRIYSSLFWFKVEEISWQNRTNLISSHHWVISVFFSFQVYFAFFFKKKRNGFFCVWEFWTVQWGLTAPSSDPFPLIILSFCLI